MAQDLSALQAPENERQPHCCTAQRCLSYVADLVDAWNLSTNPIFQITSTALRKSSKLPASASYLVCKGFIGTIECTCKKKVQV